MTITDLLQYSHRAMMASNNKEWADDLFLNHDTISISDHTTPDTKVTLLKTSNSNDAHISAPIEWHPLIPFLPSNTKILFLGSFPPQRKRWCMDFFYPNFINDHWRIEGLVFYNDSNYFVDQLNKSFKLKDIVTHLKLHGIGFFDTAIAVRRLAENASDKFLEVVEPTDIDSIVGTLPSLKAIVTTGEKATETLAISMGMKDSQGNVLIPKVNSFITSSTSGIDIYRLPSSSRAYPMPLDKKAEAYRTMFERYL